MKTGSSFRFVVFLLWSSAVFFASLFLFTGGFLLRRHELPDKSTCINSTRTDKSSCNSVPGQYSKSVIIIIDALKYEFAVFNQSLSPASTRPFQNRLPVFSQTQGGRLFEFVADPPTTTMQRLKGLTTGNLPTFVDVSANFASYEIKEDNIIDQLVNQGRKVVFAGDDTWMGLFPDRFSRAFPFPSFDVWDLDTVDNGVTKHLLNEIESEQQDWDVLIGHYLGVDHAGHKYGPNHPEMTRKLDEMNKVIERVIKNLPDDCILFVMGDHGMTSTGDHGGDSDEELSAALYVYSKKTLLKPLKETISVNQVDFVPTFSLLLGLPIPFSNLGTVIHDALALADDKVAATKQLQYVGLNLDQVFRYLETYQRLSTSSESHASPLHVSKYEDAILQASKFRSKKNSALKPSEASNILQLGAGILSQVKAMCKATFVEFNIPRITFGLSLSFFHVCLLTVLAMVPKNVLLRRFISLDLLAGLGMVLMLGTGLVLASVFLNSGKNSPLDVLAFYISVAVSLLFFACTLIWRIRSSMKEILDSLWVTDPACWLHYVLYGLLIGGLFSNSFVVNEASLVAFCVAASVAIHSLTLLSKQTMEGQKFNLFLISLVIMGLLRCVRVYFRCREEQQGFCQPTDYHKSIGTLSQDVSRDAKNLRFFFTILSVYLSVQLPHLWLKVCGNLNGMSIPVMVTGYAPWVAGFSMVCHWAIQGLQSEMAAKLLPWQNFVLAQFSWGMCALAILVVPLGCPNLTFMLRELRQREIPKAVDGVGTFFNLIKSNWREHFSLQGMSRQRTIFGLGTSLSAPFIVLAVNFGLATMLVLGDGLCPSICLALIIGSTFLYLTSMNRLDIVHVENWSGFDLMQTPWSVVMGWYFLECLFFFGSGHQPTFPTIQWSAAFVGFSNEDHGNEAGIIQSNVIPAILIGWNTFAFRILFGLLLPSLMLSPFAVWMMKYSSQNKNEKNSFNGEMFLVDHEEEAKAQLFRLCTKYLVLQGIRLFASMLSAALLRRHLMVWKIFAPRFIFEGIGFIVSSVSILIGYAIYVRVQNIMSSYIRDICEKEK